MTNISVSGSAFKGVFYLIFCKNIKLLLLFLEKNSSWAVMLRE